MLARGLRAWAAGEEGIDSEAGSLVVAETVLMIRGYLLGLAKKK